MAASEDPVVLQEANSLRRQIQLQTVFTPAAPVQRKELFAPRVEQVVKVVGAVSQVGRHVVLYGERGVGKTSLASLIYDFMNEALHDSGIIFPRVNCDKADNYQSIWAKVAEQISIIYARREFNFPKLTTQFGMCHKHLRDNVAEPDLVRRYLELADRPIVIIVDEFDRVPDNESRTAFADTIKMLSDHGITSTLVLLGVADTIDQLISEHASIQRNLVQVKMPRMSRAELSDVVQRGLEQVEMTIAGDALDWIVDIARGLPHYAHLLGLYSATHAAGSRPFRTSVEPIDIADALDAALKDVQETIQVSYQRATASAHLGHIYGEVLFACAIAPVDDLGYFAPADVREPLSLIMKQHYDIPAFVPHLNRFCTPSKGSVLEMAGPDRRHRFRFVDPLMAPYLTMRGIRDKILDRNWLKLTTRRSTP